MMKSYSDRRLKKKIRRIRNDDGSLMKMDGHQMYTWEWNEEGRRVTGSKEKDNIGVIAQHVQRRRPDCVYLDTASGYLKVDYGKLFERVG